MIQLAKIFRTLTVRASSILTNAYVAGEEIDAKDCNTLVLYVNYTGGSLTSTDIKISYSYDASTWYQESMTTAATGTTTQYENIHKFSSDGSYRLKIPVLDRFVKIESIGNGTVTGSLLAISSYVGIA